MDPDRGIAPAHVDMVGQCEMANSEVPGDVGQSARKLDFASDFSNIPDKRLYTIEHPRFGFAAARVPSHVSPRRPSHERELSVSQNGMLERGPEPFARNGGRGAVQIYSLDGKKFDRN